MPTEYVLTENGNIKITDGQPTVKDGDKEFTIDAIGAQDKITSITAESNDRRKKLGEANTALEAFKGIEDPTAAIDALQKIKSMDKDQATALENLKTTINQTWETKQAEWNEEKKGLNDKLFKANVTSQFATSKVLKETILTPDIAESFFGKHFNSDGTANDSAGNLIYSKEKPGEPASFDDSLQFLIDSYPNKDAILKGSGAHGRGGDGDNSSNSSGKTMTRDDFEKKSPSAKSAFINDGGTVI